MIAAAAASEAAAEKKSDALSPAVRKLVEEHGLDPAAMVGSGKDGRRYMISDNYCVIALAGDQLGDIADIFNDKALTPPERKALIPFIL